MRYSSPSGIFSTLAGMKHYLSLVFIFMAQGSFSGQEECPPYSDKAYLKSGGLEARKEIIKSPLGGGTENFECKEGAATVLLYRDRKGVVEAEERYGDVYSMERITLPGLEHAYRIVASDSATDFVYFDKEKRSLSPVPGGKFAAIGPENLNISPASIAPVRKIKEEGESTLGPGYNEKNWMAHPEVKAIRNIYSDIEASIRSGSLKTRTCQQQNYAIYEDSSNVVRKYQAYKLTEHAALEARYYYDVSGRIRFSFLSMAAVNGTVAERRIYFNLDGSVLYRDRRLIQGEGWMGWPDESLADPEKEFYSACRSRLDNP